MYWIVGTSVSIEEGGYVTRLQRRLQPSGESLTNLSVGDQTSMMGYMRLLMHSAQIRRGDVVVWEYSLLDTLLTDSIFDVADVHKARRLAWKHAQGLGAQVVVVLTPPKIHLDQRSDVEQQIVDEAQAQGFAVYDLRDSWRSLQISNPIEHYRDDRHLRLDSPVIDFLVEDLLRCRERRSIRSERRGKAAPAEKWAWLDARDIAKQNQHPLQTFANSLMSIESIVLPVDARLTLPPHRRVVAAGVISTHTSGGAWCGHPCCPPSSTRLPADLRYGFLARTTALACVRRERNAIVSAPTWAYARGHWADYGQAPCDEPGDVALFGVLYEPEEEIAGRWAALRSVFRA